MVSLSCQWWGHRDIVSNWKISWHGISLHTAVWLTLAANLCFTGKQTKCLALFYSSSIATDASRYRSSCCGNWHAAKACCYFQVQQDERWREWSYNKLSRIEWRIDDCLKVTCSSWPFDTFESKRIQCQYHSINTRLIGCRNCYDRNTEIDGPK